MSPLSPPHYVSRLLPTSIWNKLRNSRGRLSQMKPCRCESLSFQTRHGTTLTFYAAYLLNAILHYAVHRSHCNFALYKGELDDFCLELSRGDPTTDQSALSAALRGQAAYGPAALGADVGIYFGCCLTKDHENCFIPFTSLKFHSIP